MEARIRPVTVVELVDMLISGREKLAKELVTELRETEGYIQRRKRQ